MTANDNDTQAPPTDPGLAGVEPDLVELYRLLFRTKQNAISKNYRTPEQTARGAEIIRRCVALLREIGPMGRRPAAEQLDYVRRVREESADLLRP